jgi:ABC-type Zn2+ transport system substrate-binding protein/surface adhesin
MVETTTISTISQPTASSTIFSIKAKQDEDNSISVGIQFKNEESLLNEHKSHNKSHTHNAKKKKHWHHHKEEHLWRTGARVRKRAGNGAGKKGKRRAGKKELWVSGAIS